MQEFVRTVSGASLQTAQLLGKPVEIKNNSTLNQKFDIQPNTAISDADIPVMKYVTIGNGGIKVAIGANNIPKMIAIQHSTRDTALYNHLPFILRLPNDDLNSLQRANYRLRRVEKRDGVSYVAYYLKLLDLSQTSPQTDLRVVNNGITTSTPYTPTLADLNPTPPNIDSNSVLVTTGDYIACTAKVPFNLNAWEIAELLNVCNIIYGDDGYALISEIGVCSGVDRSVMGDFNGSTIGYTEAIAVQICSFMNTSIPIKYINSSFNLTLDVGSVEPLLSLTPQVPVP